jgi:hypothetical protein
MSSLCYDFEKHMMITFAVVAAVLIVGLIMLVGQAYAIDEVVTLPDGSVIDLSQVVTLPDGSVSRLDDLFDKLSNGKFNQMQIMIDYCYQHAAEPNPIQNLIDKGLVSSDWNGATCASIKQATDNFMLQAKSIIYGQK